MNERNTDRFACFDMKSLGWETDQKRFALANGFDGIRVGDSLEELNLIAVAAGLDVAPFVQVWDDTKDAGGIIRGAWVPSGTRFWIDAPSGGQTPKSVTSRTG